MCQTHSHRREDAEQFLAEYLADETGRGRRARAPDEDMLETVSAIGSQVGQFLERAQAEEELRETKEELQALIQASPVPIVAYDAGGIVTIWNPAAERVFGWSEEEAIGRLLPIVPDDMLEEFHQIRTQALAGTGFSGYETRRQRKDGSPLDVIFSNAAVRDADGNPRGVVAVIADFTEHKRIERLLEKQASELARSNRDLEQFAYAASHDLQAPLRTIGGFAELLADNYGGQLDAEADEFIGFIVDGAARMQDVISDLLAYSRVGSEVRVDSQCDSESALRSAVEDLQGQIADSGAVLTHDRLPRVRAAEPLLRQLFQNLLSNALKFSGEDAPRIHTSAKKNNDSWEFSVRDNGIGIDPRHTERIFDIFQRLHTQEEYDGTGMGLTICKRIVDHHGGQIWVDADQAKGVTFKFTLPAK